MARLFDAYIIVDWSAAAKPATGANSIWVGVYARDARLKLQFRAMNPKTRLEARQFIVDMTNKLTSRGDRVLIGLDFGIGYPAGTAEAAGLSTDDKPAWRAMQQHLAGKVKEKSDNSNARFAIAAGLNYAISKGPFPFWGAPKRDVATTLAATKGDFSGRSGLPEYRISERWLKEERKLQPKSVWQLYGAGSVGGQSLLGIPTLAYLRDQLDNSTIWPFETGLTHLTDESLGKNKVVFAEVYPSSVKITPEPGEIIDAAQVRSLATHLARLDEKSQLAPLFGGPGTLSDTEIAAIEGEEGWILAG